MTYPFTASPQVNELALSTFLTGRGLLTQDWRPSFLTPVMASPPTITQNLSGTGSGITGAVLVPSSDPRFTWLSTIPRALASDASFVFPGHVSSDITDPSIRQVNALGRVLFSTDATKFGIRLRGNGVGQVRLKIDGAFNTITLPITAGGDNGTQYMVVDFGAIAKSSYAQSSPTLGSGGTGYVVGDVVTVVGGTGTAAQFRVATITGGVVTSVFPVVQGAYTAIPSSPTATTGGTGTGLTLNPRWEVRVPTKLVRQIEIWGSGFQFGGVAISPQDVLLATLPLYGNPRTIFIGDSLSTASYQDAAGEMWYKIVAEGMGVQDFWQSASPGTGWLATSGNIPYLGQRLATDIFPIITNNTVLVYNLGINDSNSNASAVLAEATSVFTRVQTNFPRCLQVVLGCFQLATDDKSAINTAIQQAVLAAPDQSRIKYVDTTGIITGTGTSTAPTGVGNSDFYRDTDGTHMGSFGHTNYGKAVGPMIANTITNIVRTT